MIRVGTNPIIFLLDNAEYVIEEQIHPGSYNKLQNWDYCALAHAMKGKSDNLYAVKVSPSDLHSAPSPLHHSEHRIMSHSMHQHQLRLVLGLK